jgi:hypothetical protein
MGSLAKLKQVIGPTYNTSNSALNDYVSGETKKKIKLRKINPKEREEIFKDYYEQRTKFNVNNKTPGVKTSQHFFKKSSPNFTNSDDTRASLIQETSEYLNEHLGHNQN